MSIEARCLGVNGHKPFYQHLGTYDLSGGDTYFTMGHQVASFPLVSFQFVWSGVTGTLDGVVTLEMTNDQNCVDWCEIPEFNGSNVIKGDIDTASGSLFLIDTKFSAALVRARLDVTGITGGTLNVYAIGKR